MDRLAIVIPYYKIDYFEETLKSLQIQTNKNFNLYIGNDASPNDPLPSIKKYFNSNEYKYFKYEDNLGSKNLALQWERILKNVTEEWFQILGDDDFVSINFVEEFYKNIDKPTSSINVIKIKSVMCDGNNTITKKMYESFSTGYYNTIDFIIKKISGRVNSSLSEHIFRTNKYKEIKFDEYDLAWHTDDMFILKASNFKDFLFIAEARVFVRVYKGSTSGSDNNLCVKKNTSIIFYNDLSDILKNKKISWSKRQLYLRSLKKQKTSLGMENLKRIYYKNGIRGMIYYKIYLTKLFLKNFIPEMILEKIER